MRFTTMNVKTKKAMTKALCFSNTQYSSASLGSVMWSRELCCDSNEVTKSPNEHLCGETMLCPQTRAGWGH